MNKVVCSKPQFTKNQQGITYIEIMIVVVILGIIAVVAMPDLASNDHRKLDIATKEIIQAIRFAQLEAMRTNIPHGIVFNVSNNTGKVYKLISGVVNYEVYHPVSKKRYTLSLNTDNTIAGVDLQSYNIYFDSFLGVNQPYLGFNTNGNPIYSSSGTNYMLNSATITLAYAGNTKVIRVSPMTGRVTAQ